VVVLPAALRTGHPPVRAALCETFQIPAAARILARVVDLGKRLTKAFVKPRSSHAGHDAARGAVGRADSARIPPRRARTCRIAARRASCAAARTGLSVSARLTLERLSRGAPRAGRRKSPCRAHRRGTAAQPLRLPRPAQHPAAAPAVPALTSLAGCGPNTSRGGEGDGALRIYWWGGDLRNGLTREALELFSDAHEDIEVSPEYSEWTGYWDKLATQFAGGDAPDVLQMDEAYIDSYGTQSSLLDL